MTVSRIPANAPKPQDRKPRKTPAQKAAQAEAEGEGYITVEQCGVTLRVPVLGKVPLTAVVAAEQGDNLKATELLLGTEQWSAYLAANPTLDDFNDLSKQLEELTGN